MRVVVFRQDGMNGLIGYLSRKDAVAYRLVIDRLAALGWLTGCRASLKGGQQRDTGEHNYIGVTLYIGQPEALMAEVDRDDPRPAWEQQR